MDDALRARIARLPTQAGVYLMKDRQGDVVYVGKAANLRSRVRAYFNQGSDGRAFIPQLPALLGDIDTLVVDNDKEALLLENQLIKQHQPRFNVKLKDDANYLSIRLDTSHPWPRVDLVRRVKKDGARYFGPYASATSIRATLRVLNRHFQLRTCSDAVLNNRSRPCLLYQIQRCPAPCVLDVDSAEYADNVEAAALFLEGRRDELVEGLRTRMRQMAEELHYERAAQLRDQLEAIERVLVRQEVIFTHQQDEDIFGFARAGDLAFVQVLQVRRGHLRDSKRYPLAGVELPDAEVLASFVNQYYDGGAQVPHRVLVPLELADARAKELWLSDKGGRKVEVARPRRGRRRRMVETACRNAQIALEEHGRDESHREGVLDGLRDKLRLARTPAVIDCVDISLFQGAEPVGSVVRFRDALPDKDGYRRFRIKTVQGTDDFAMMYEVLTRHLRRSAEAGELPDLLVVDGGKGQLGVGRAALEDLGLDDVDCASLAKSRVIGHDRDDTTLTSPERIFRPGARDPIVLDPRSAEVHLLQRVRDEAHRFAITYHRKRRTKKTLRSDIDAIPGIGAARRKALLTRFGSVQALRRASAREIASVPGIGAALAKTIVESL